MDRKLAAAIRDLTPTNKARALQKALHRPEPAVTQEASKPPGTRKSDAKIGRINLDYAASEMQTFLSELKHMPGKVVQDKWTPEASIARRAESCFGYLHEILEAMTEHHGLGPIPEGRCKSRWERWCLSPRVGNR